MCCNIGAGLGGVPGQVTVTLPVSVHCMCVHSCRCSMGNSCCSHKTGGLACNRNTGVPVTIWDHTLKHITLFSFDIFRSTIAPRAMVVFINWNSRNGRLIVLLWMWYWGGFELYVSVKYLYTNCDATNYIKHTGQYETKQSKHIITNTKHTSILWPV